jgi:hypothetical protein
MREVRMYRMPDKEVINKAHSHDLEALVKLADLNLLLASAGRSDPQLDLNWTTVKDWSEVSRYQVWTETEAVDMFQAVADRNHGVLQWIKQHW